MGHHPKILELEDEGLVRASVLVTYHGLFPELSITNWEREFLGDMPNYWARTGEVSWKQRRSLRRILSKITEELERRKSLGEWIFESKPKAKD